MNLEPFQLLIHMLLSEMKVQPGEALHLRVANKAFLLNGAFMVDISVNFVELSVTGSADVWWRVFLKLMSFHMVVVSLVVENVVSFADQARILAGSMI